MVVGSSRSPPPGKNGNEENIYHNIYFGILVYLLISTEFLQRNKRTKIIIIRHFLPHFPCFLLGDFSFTYHFGVCVCERVSVRESFVRTFLSSLIKLMGPTNRQRVIAFHWALDRSMRKSTHIHWKSVESEIRKTVFQTNHLRLFPGTGQQYKKTMN